MQSFSGRQRERKLLLDHLTRPGAGLFVLRGRRRVGKTTLLRHVLGELEGAAFHVGTKSTTTDELRRLSRELARSWRMPYLEREPLRSWEGLFERMASLEGRRILVLDEFPYLVESERALPGLLQAAWDRDLQHSQHKIVVCGSSVAMMERTFFSERSPLFGRRTGQLRLLPLGPASVAEILGLGTLDAIETAALFGGLPGHLVRLERGASARGNLLRRVLASGEPLYEEVPFLLREELREPRVYQAVLSAIAGGARRFGEIASKVGLDRANLSRYLGTLDELGLVEREVSVLERTPDKSRRGLYRVSDPFVATWFAFVHRHRDRLERGEHVEAFEQEIEPRLPAWLGRAVEPTLTALLRRGPGAARLPFRPVHVGRHWRGDREFDVVMLDEERTQAVVLEIKWSRRPVGAGALAELRRRIGDDAELGALDCTSGVMSRSGFTAAARAGEEGGLLFEAEELLGPPTP